MEVFSTELCGVLVGRSHVSWHCQVVLGSNFRQSVLRWKVCSFYQSWLCHCQL